MNTFPQPGQANFQQFAGQAPAPTPAALPQPAVPQPQQFAQAPQPQQFAQAPQPQQFAQAPQPQQFAQAPQPQQFAQPAQNYGPGPGQPQQLAAPAAAFGPGAFDGTTKMSHQDPTPEAGDYILEIEDTELKTENGRTHVTTFTVIDNFGNASGSHIGSKVASPQKLDGNKWSFKYGSAAILEMTVAMTGFKDESTFKAAVPAWSPLMNAMCDNRQQLAGNPWPPNPLKGRRAHCAVRFTGKMTEPKNPKYAPKPIMSFSWTTL